MLNITIINAETTINWHEKLNREDAVRNVNFRKSCNHKLINHPVSQDTARNPVMLRRSARINKGKPPRRFYYDYSDSE